MPAIPIIMPQLGESIAEATVVNLLIKVGDEIRADQDIIEVETSKATMSVSAPCAGRIEKLMVTLNESYPVGAVLGQLQVTAEEAARVGLDAPPAETAHGNGQTEHEAEDHPASEPARRKVQPTVRGLPVPANA